MSRKKRRKEIERLIINPKVKKEEKSLSGEVLKSQ